MQVKESGFSRTAPSEKTDDGRPVSFGGMLWDPVIDGLKPKITQCHFGIVAWEGVKLGIEIFEGTVKSEVCPSPD